MLDAICCRQGWAWDTPHKQDVKDSIVFLVALNTKALGVTAGSPHAKHEQLSLKSKNQRTVN